MSEDFMLKWNDHHSLFFVGAEELCESEEYTDVTLAAGSKFFSAHKLVLSICSPYFRQLFKHLGKDKPVIFLKDVNHNQLLNLKNPSNIDPPFKKGVPKKQEEIPESQ